MPMRFEAASHVKKQGNLEYDDKAWQARLRKIFKHFPEITEPAMLKGVLFLIQEMPDYPPEKPTSARQYTLERTMSALVGSDPYALSEVQVQGGEVVGLLGTRLAYAPYVIGRESQAWMHEDYWWLLEDHVEENLNATAQVILGELDQRL
jgi:hypothetical protein